MIAFPCLATPSSILRNGDYNVTFNYTSVRGNLTEPPLVNSNISWCPADDDLLRNPVLVVDLGESTELTCLSLTNSLIFDDVFFCVRPRPHLPFSLETEIFVSSLAYRAKMPGEGGGWGLLPYISHTGMCHPIG